MKRRQFLKTTTTSVGLPLVLNGLGLSAMAKPLLFGGVEDDNDRVLVLIQLAGGNDGLNTIIPLDQYANLFKARENIIIPENRILEGTDTIGFHPNMIGMKRLFDDHQLSIIQSVGYPNQNRSHFRSIEIWNTASKFDEYLRTGWLGRYLADDHPNFPTNYPNNDFPDPFAISMGYQVAETCQGNSANYSIALTDPFGLRQLPQSDNPDDTNSLYLQELNYLTETIIQTNQYSTSIDNAASLGNNTVTYPDTELAHQLKNVALLISGGLKTKIYTASLGGFDTHAVQVQGGDPTRGIHADLLETLSDAVAAFQQDITALGLEKRVVGMTFSEFGRQIQSNGGFGTDHGTAAPLLLFGHCIRPQIMGHNPEIPDQVDVQEGVPMQYDFRDVYGSVLLDWFQLTEDMVKRIIHEEFQYLPIVDNCNITVSTSNLPNADFNAYAAPNPFKDLTQIYFTLERSERVRLNILNALGQEVITLVDKTLDAGQHVVEWSAGSLAAGNYYYQLRSGGVSRVGLIAKIK